MKNLVAQFILRLQDRASSGLMRIQQRLGGIAAMARRVALVGAAVSGIALAGPVREAAAFDDRLRTMGQTAGQTGAALDAFINQRRVQFEALARETGQSSDAIAAAAGQMLAAGLPEELVARFLPLVARAATATGGSMQDLGNVVTRFNQNLGIASYEDMAGALAAVVQSSRDGSVEINNLARLLPGLTARMQGLNMAGREAANSLMSMLQVAARGAATADEAGNNLGNFLSKITSPETVRNFEKMGVDIQGVLRSAAAQGINPVEAVIQKIREITGGDMFKVGELFGDMQVLDFLRPMLASTQEYLTLLRGAAAAQAGLVDQGFEDRFRGAQIQMALLGEQVTQLTRRIGTAAGQFLTPLNEQLGAFLAWLERVEKESPALVSGIITAGGAFLGLAAAIGVVGLVAGPIAAGLALVGKAAMALLSPFGLAALAIAGAALHIWQQWDRFRGFFQGMLDGLRTALAGLGAFLTGVFTGDVQEAVAGIMQLWDGLAAYLENLWGVVRTLFTDFATFLDGWTGGAVTSAVSAFRAAFEGLTSFFEGLWAGIRAPFDAFIGGVTAGIERIQQLWQGVRDRFAAGQAAEGAPPAMGGVQARQAAAAAARGSGFYPPETLAGASAANSNAPVNGEIVVRAAPGSEVVSAEGSNRNVPVTAAPDRGATRARR